MKKLLILLILVLAVGCSPKDRQLNQIKDESEQDEQQKQHNSEDKMPIKEDIGNQKKSSDLQGNEEEKDKPVEIDYEIVQPNEIGHIMIVMYHGIIDNPPYHRTEENFKKDLQYLYDHDYRLISMKDYLSNRIDIEAGKTPIIFTFDDALSTTFSLEDKDGELVPKEGTAISIMEEFAKEHPDFGKDAMLYIYGSEKSTFEGAGSYEERLQWLLDHGYEIGNHVNGHPNLSHINGVEIEKNIGIIHKMVLDSVGYEIYTISYPYGVTPDEENKSLAFEGAYNGIQYNYLLGVREAVRNPMVPPVHKDFDPMECSRTRGSEGEYGDLWYFLGYYEDHPEEKYISDGNVNRIAVPEELNDQVNQEKVKDFELYLY